MKPTDDVLADDVTHPIPEVGACDVKGVRKGGGADLVIVIATPFENDERSRRRLVQKFRNYLGHIVSEEFVRECGSPSPESTAIVVHVHPDSDSKALAFIEECRGWIYDNHASLVVKKLANQALVTTAMTQPPSATSTAPLSHLNVRQKGFESSY